MAHPRLGQHFLTDTRILDTIVKTAALSHNDTVLEVGPGEGVLTRELLKKAGKVIAVEKDPALVHKLEERFGHERTSEKLLLHLGDIRYIPLESLGLQSQAYVVVANIPYYLTGLLIRKILSENVQPKSAVLLIQKEVAQRIAKSAKESLLSLSVKAYGTPRYVMSVSRSAFKPQPAVESAILLIENISRNFFKDVDEAIFFKALKSGFGKKRKRLTSNLSEIFKREHVTQVFEAQNLSQQARAEDLSLEKWKGLIGALLKLQ